MEKLGERSCDRISETSPRPRYDGSWAELCVEESRAYMMRVCGPGVPAGVVAQALEDVARVVPADSRPASMRAFESVRRTVRDAALGETQRSGAAAGRELGGVACRNGGCVALPGLLRARAMGRLPAQEAVALYQLLDRCPPCAQLTDRFDAAEWHLRQALSPSSRATTAGAAGKAARSGVLEAAPASTGSRASGEEARRWVEPGRAGRGPGRPASPLRPGIRPGHGLRGRARAVAAAAVVLLLLTGIVALTRATGAGGSGPSVIYPISRQPLPSIPITPPSTSSETLPPGVPEDELVLGSPGSRELIPAAATPSDLAGIAAGVVLGTGPPMPLR